MPPFPESLEPILKLSIQTLGSLGDVMPYISLGLRLKAQGHSVSLLAPPDYSTLIASYGLSVAPTTRFTISGWIHDAAAQGTLSHPLNFLRDWNALVAPRVDEVVAVCLSAAEGQDAIIANAVCAPSRLAAELQRIPFILTAQQPILSPSRDVPNAMVWRPVLGNWMNRPSYAWIHLCQRFMERALRKHRKALGLDAHPPLHDMRTHLGRPLARITSVSPPLIPTRPADWSARDYLTPYPSLPKSTTHTLPQGVETFLLSGPAPIYIGLGSLDWGGHPISGEALLAGLARTGQRAIFSRGFADSVKRNLARHLIIDTVPHDVLFSHCAAVLHHGGAGTLDTAMRAGRPQIIMPHFFDQFWHAKRLFELGLAPTPLKRVSTADQFAAAFAFAASPGAQARAREVALEIAPLDGPGLLTQTIEKLLSA